MGEVEMSDVLQCPHCALRFSTRSELEQHKAIDHPQTLEEEVPASAEPEPEAPVEPEREDAAETSEKRGFWSRLFGGS
jgi:hypothetical protein